MLVEVSEKKRQIEIVMGTDVELGKWEGKYASFRNKRWEESRRVHIIQVYVRRHEALSMWFILSVTLLFNNVVSIEIIQCR
jgi:hypothetical protein